MKLKSILIWALISIGIAANADSTYRAEKILKIDLGNLLGAGIQKAQIQYEFQFKPKHDNQKVQTSLQFNLNAPFNSWSDMKYDGGGEAGVQLRIYPRNLNRTGHLNQYYWGIGYNFNLIQFQRPVEIGTNCSDLADCASCASCRTGIQPYKRIGNATYFFVGKQTYLGEKWTVDTYFGLGFANSVVKEQSVLRQSQESVVNSITPFTNPMFELYNEGNNSSVYVPFGISLGYRL